MKIFISPCQEMFLVLSILKGSFSIAVIYVKVLKISIGKIFIMICELIIFMQMGGIDEAALDRLSLVTEMTKHIRVRASQDKSSVAELGQYSPIFLWLLRVKTLTVSWSCTSPFL